MARVVGLRREGKIAPYDFGRSGSTPVLFVIAFLSSRMRTRRAIFCFRNRPNCDLSPFRLDIPQVYGKAKSPGKRHNVNLCQAETYPLGLPPIQLVSVNRDSLALQRPKSVRIFKGIR